MDDRHRNITAAVDNLIYNGFQVTIANFTAQTVTAVDNDGNVITVTVGGAGYCTVKIGESIIANLVQPYNVGAAARLRRHVGMFE